MRNLSTMLLGVIIFTLSPSITFSQLKVESNGSLYVNSLAGNWGRANWTKVHHRYSCAYHLNSTYYNSDVFYVRGDGYAWTRHGFLTASDSTLKTNIRDIQYSLSKIKKLRGVQYNLKYTIDSIISNERNENLTGRKDVMKVTKLEPMEYGLIAQEVEAIIPESVVTLHDSTKAINYMSLIPVLIEAIKEQQVQIEKLKKEFEEYHYVNKGTKTEDGASLDSSSSKYKYKECLLFQNYPNPFNTETTIRYILDKNVEDAQLLILNMQGTLIRSYKNLDIEEGKVVIDSEELKAGMYIYSLVVHGVIIDTKNMILTD